MGELDGGADRCGPQSSSSSPARSWGSTILCLGGSSRQQTHTRERTRAVVICCSRTAQWISSSRVRRASVPRRGRRRRPPAWAIASHVREDAIQRPRHTGEIQRADEEGRCADLATAACARSAGAVPRCSAPPLGLLLEGAERHQVALRFEDPFDGVIAEAADQLVEVLDAHVETRSSMPWRVRSTPRPASSRPRRKSPSSAASPDPRAGRRAREGRRRRARLMSSRRRSTRRRHPLHRGLGRDVQQAPPARAGR